MIATKAGFTRPGPGEWVRVRPARVPAPQCEGSLRRLGVERIDLFQLHRIDPQVPADDQFGALKELRDEGKVAEVGLSEVSVAQVEAARRIVPIVSVQNQYNIGLPRRRRSRRLLRTAPDRVHPVVPAGQRQAGPTGRPPRPGGPGAGRHHLPGVPGLAPAPLAGDAPHPRHVVGRPSRGELRRRALTLSPSAVRRADRGPQAVAALDPGRLSGSIDDGRSGDPERHRRRRHGRPGRAGPTWRSTGTGSPRSATTSGAAGGRSTPTA